MEDQAERVEKLKKEKADMEREVEQLMKEKGWKEPEKTSTKKVEIQKLKYDCYKLCIISISKSV